MCRRRQAGSVVGGGGGGHGGTGVASCSHIGAGRGTRTSGIGGAPVKHSFTVRIGPAAFRIGSAWPAPISLLRTRYADYPQPEDGLADFSVRLEPAKPWRRWLGPAVAIAGDHMLPEIGGAACRVRVCQ